jgi:hypothetical protein
MHLPMHMVFGNPMPSGVIGRVCDACGYLSAWDTRLPKRYQKLLKDAE